MASPDLNRLRYLLAGLREPPPSKEYERRAMTAFERVLGRKAEREEDRRPPGPERRR